jgi:nitrogen regulatory protein PII
MQGLNPHRSLSLASTGKIFVTPLGHAVRTRTGKTGRGAL